MPAYGEEMFGPAAAVIAVRNEAAAIAAANDTIYGLGAAVFSRNRRRARNVATRLEAGVVFINDFVRSDPTLPFGGVKQSGYGRELGPNGMLEFEYKNRRRIGPIWSAPRQSPMPARPQDKIRPRGPRGRSRKRRPISTGS
jgi:acyl-CoA reductase-like NAD-dependent aldehyde dehydrogenase